MASPRAINLVSGREPFVCAELGSCHLGDKAKLFKLSEQTIRSGADGLKLQLFPDDPKYTKANHYLKPSIFEEWVWRFSKKTYLGVTVFDLPYPGEEIMRQLAFIKVARPNALSVDYVDEMTRQQTLFPHLVTVGSFGYMDCFNPRRFIYDVALYCHAINGHTAYPVTEILDWSSILHNTRVDGISDHTLNVEWSISKEFNVIWVEKHVMLDDQRRNSCGDAHFAIPIEDFKRYVSAMKDPSS